MVRRHRNLIVPRSLTAKKCAECGGDFDFPWSKGTKFKGVQGLVYPARCKAHQLDPIRCSVTTVYFDKLGNRIEVPRFAPRKLKRLPYERPNCPQCGLGMGLAAKATKRIVTSSGHVQDESVQGFRCEGGRWNKVRHPRSSVYCNSKGGPVQVVKGKHKKLSQLPVTLLKSYPHCEKCGKLMARQAGPYKSRSGQRTWWFRCHRCGKSRGFDDSGKLHTP